MNFRSLLRLLALCALALVSTTASAQDLQQAAKALGSGDKDQVASAVDEIAKSSDKAALIMLEALSNDALRVDGQGVPFVAGESDALTPVFGGSAKPSGGLTTPLVDNRMRRQLEPALASLKLSFP